MWNKNCGGYGVMKKKKLSPYEKLKKALLIDHVLGLSFIEFFGIQTETLI